MSVCCNPPDSQEKVFKPEHNSTQRAQVNLDNPNQTVNDAINEAMRYMRGEQIPQFDTEGREWCPPCKEYLHKGHLHKGTPEHKEMSDKAREEGMSFDGMQRHATSPRLNMSPAYMQDKLMEMEKYLVGCRLELGHLIEHTVKELKESVKQLFRMYNDLSELRHETNQNEGCTRAKVENVLMPLVETLQKEFRYWGERYHERLKKIEEWGQTPSPWAHANDVNELEKKLDEVCKNFDANRVIIHREPFKCPNCHGAGEWELTSIEETIRNGGRKIKQCHSCEGKGIVWA